MRVDLRKGTGGFEGGAKAESSAKSILVSGGFGAVSLCNLCLSYTILGSNWMIEGEGGSEKLGSNEIEIGST